MRMKSASIPTFESVYESLGSVLVVIRQALEKGTAHVQSYSEWQDEPIDRSLAPGLVRHKAKAFLLERKQEVTDEPGFEDEQGFRTEHLANNGLCLRTNGFQVRILKSENGCIPPPGPSQARNRFYSQQLTLPGMEGYMDEPDPWGIIVHWTVDEDYNLLRLGLSMPKSGGKSSATVETYWDRAFWTRPQAVTQPLPQVVDLDIPFEIREADDTIGRTDAKNDLRRQGEADSRATGVDAD